jgi:Protein of unknown function (DUF1593)/Ca-dependent carbohydrate-binding module xylan-binding
MAKPRVFISTDLKLTSEEKDDAQSLIHALLYQDKINIVGIAGTASKWGHQNGRVSDIDAIIDVYGKDLAKLQAHASGFKSVAELKAISHQGATAVAPSAGFSSATASSKAIVAEAKKAAAAGETLNVLTWGGETDMAQALHDDPSIAAHVRFFNIGAQDTAAKSYLLKNFKGAFDMWVDNMSTFRGMYATPTAKKIITGWHETHAKGHGALGDYFAKLSGDIFNVSGVKMGDSPTVLRFLSGDQNDPTKESWGGEFRKVSEGYYTDRTDSAFEWGATNGAMTIYEDRAAWLSSLAQRFDWLKSTTAPLPPVAPSKPVETGPVTDDALNIRVSGDSGAGGLDPIVKILVDGVHKGSFKVTADHADGAWQTIAIDGNWKAGVNHKIEVKFYEKASSQAVYLDSVTLNGDMNGTDVTMLKSGNKLYWLGDDAL